MVISAKLDSKMEIIHTPSNIASLPSHTIRALNSMNVHSRGLIYSNSATQNMDGLTIFTSTNLSTLPRLQKKTQWLSALIRASEKPGSVIHWYYGKNILPLWLDVILIGLLKRRGLVEWMGSDIRDPVLESAQNPYYARAYKNGYEYTSAESHQKSRKRQRMFARASFHSAADLALHPFIAKDIFPKTYFLPRRLIADDYLPEYPEPTDCPLILHAPSAPIAKGTEAVISAIEHLKGKYSFRFEVLQNLPRASLLNTLKKGDIVLDQFVLGDYGMLSLEAMALGKPVICFINEPLAKILPPEMPIFNSTQEMLAENIARLLENAKIRRELGMRGRNYIEKFHDMKVVLPNLLQIYTDILKT
jgi:hypothetical protein